MAFRLSRRPSRQYIAFALLCIALFFFVSLNLGKPSTTAYTPPTRPIVVEEDITVEYVKPEDHELLEDIRIDTSREEETAENQRKLIDRKYCGRDNCRFLLPITITEQESKAQMHFRQLAFLSGRLDRTIVLPNVHSSHLGVCRRLPFSFYYSYEWLDNNKRFFNYISLEDFKEWARERAQIAIKPTAQELYVEVNENFHFLDGVQNCMQHYMNFEGRTTKRFVLEDPERSDRRQGNYSQILQTAMSDHSLNDGYANGKVTDIPSLDVINLYYDRRFPYIEDLEVQEPLKYSSTWVNIAKGIADSLTPFVAIHWRMERLETLENLVYCAKDLVSQIQKLVADNGMTQYPPLFLLTDYPHLLTYAELPEKNWNIVPVPANSQPADASVLGIVDKLVAMRAQWFLAGKPGVCAKASSFTLRIMEERRKQKDLQDAGQSLPGDADIQSVAKFFTNEEV
ncbi:hypothetical protein K450DRAFT_229936 [Umbelopsis ramanniana AG]|uniref:O-fucosyltransferase family protein n=1 Tax=Umbelopsis ramanniana AG TaxID=1314678 RepID=A0AAD5HGU1_UMBRA|nr:uncharacterized protein K450DRAFT_229936 [Umbelopsis ramanniana AG]KAI8581926.1 hypothetical protein K450DRAFT_229936 [Umbelopsis ramanniana AG]